MVRTLINPKQTKQKVLATNYDGGRVLFDKKNGYAFSDDAAMDKTIEHFKSLGYKLKGEKAGLSQKKEEPKPEEKPEAKPEENKKGDKKNN